MKRSIKSLLVILVVVGETMPRNAAAGADLDCQFKNDAGELVFSISYYLGSSLLGPVNGTATVFSARTNSSSSEKIIWSQTKWAGEWGLKIFQLDDQSIPSMFVTTKYQKSKNWTQAKATLAASNMYNDQISLKGVCSR